MKKGHWLVVITGVLAGTAVFGGAIFAKHGFSLFEIVIFRSMFSLLFLPFLFYKNELKLDKKSLRNMIFFGLICAIAVLLEFAPVTLGVPVATTLLLLYTAPLWTVLFCRILFKELITKEKLIAIPLVLAGVLVLVNPFNLGLGQSIIGLVIALLGGIFMSLWGVFGKIFGEEDMHPVKTEFYETVFSLGFLAMIYPLMANFIHSPQIVSFSFLHNPTFWIYMFLFSVISEMIPHLTYFYGVKDIPGSTAGIILLLEPLSGAILAALFLAQAITINVFIGGLLIILANYLVINSERNKPELCEPETLI